MKIAKFSSLFVLFFLLIIYTRSSFILVLFILTSFSVLLFFTILIVLIILNLKRGKKQNLTLINLFSYIILTNSLIIFYSFIPDPAPHICMVQNIIFLLFLIHIAFSFIEHSSFKLKASIFLVYSIIIVIIKLLPSIEVDFAPSKERLKSLPYTALVRIEDSSKRGVTKYDKKKSFKGINYFSTNGSGYLMDMSGNILHKWKTTSKTDPQMWGYVELSKYGNLFYTYNATSLTKLDWFSKVIWKKNINYHHDLDITESGTIYALTRKEEVVFYYGLPFPILNNYVTSISEDTLDVICEISLFELLKDDIPIQKMLTIYKDLFYGWKFNLRNIFKRYYLKKFILFKNRSSDLFHTNTLEIITKPIPKVCAKGDVLLCMNLYNLICILNMSDKKIIWKWERPGTRSHQPTFLKNNNILIFDNCIDRNRYSRIVELDPLSKKIMWSYTSNPPENFFADWGGSCQRLPNGNTLVTETPKGRVFEITKDGEIVWEFFSHITEDENSNLPLNWRIGISRLKRFTDVTQYPFLQRLENNSTINDKKAAK